MTDVLTGMAGQAERITVTARTKLEEATLSAWLITAPGQSPAWDTYLLAVVHLRSIADEMPPVLRIPGATHELLLCALDPEKHPRHDDASTLNPLLPINAQCQFIVPTDELAIRLCEGAVRAILAGVLPAEPAFPRRGQDLWQGTVDRSVEHLLTGGHASGR